MQSRGHDDHWTVPALRPADDGPATRFARLTGGRPVAVFFAALLGCFVLLAAGATLLGLLVTHVLAGPLGLGGPDNDAIRSMTAHRTSFLTDASSVGSAIGGAPVLPILVGLLAIGFAIKRHWRIAAFAVFVLATESATYRVASLLVPRDRPHVKRLDALPGDASWPSGHTAASIAVYVGLAILLTSAVKTRGARIAAWTVAVLFPLIVAFSRMYRGMHHPMDVMGGALIGLATITALLFACRAAGAAAESRAPAGARAPRARRDDARGRRGAVGTAR
jgi:membrane-associated phospholipid phosphatase